MNLASPPTPFTSDHWAQIRLVVFDVDGTLYSQRPVRLAMAAALALHSLGRGSLRDARALGTFRRLREEAGERDLEDFEAILLDEAAERTGYPRDALHRLASEWLEVRPLPHLRGARFADVDRLFSALRRTGRRIAAWSDHPAADKLKTLGLEADDWISANDADLGRLKPNPAGLQRLMARAGVQPHETLMIGDRVDRDGEAARRAGTFSLIRTRRPHPQFAGFRRYNDPIFQPILGAAA